MQNLIQSFLKSTLFTLVLTVSLLTSSYSIYCQSTNQLQQETTLNEWQKLLDKQEFGRVIATSSAILQIDSNNQDALFYLGRAYLESGQEDLAAPFFANIINQHELNTNQINHYRLALCHFYLNNNDQAIKILNLVLEHANPPKKALVTLAYALAKNNQFKQSVELFNQLIAKKPTYSLHYNRALVLWELNQLIEAEQDLLSALALNPDFQLPYFDLISIHVLQNNPSKAYEWLEKLLKKREINLSRLQQDPILTDFITSDKYQALLSEYNMN